MTMRRLLLLIGALIAMTVPVAAQHWDDRYWIKKTIRQQRCDVWGECRYYYRPTYVRRPDYDSYRHLDKCKASIRVWGDQAQSKDNAQARAIVSWTGAVRFQYGEVYIDFTLAEDVKILCSPSSVSDTITSKIQERVFSTEYFRCEVQARACRPKRKEE